LFKKHSSKKKDLSHYEAIADEHLAKMYKPSSDCWGNIILLCVLGFQIGWVYLLIIYFLFQKLQTTNAKLTLLQSSIDILTIKQGLITMFPCFNAYTQAGQVKATIKDFIKWNGDLDTKNKQIIYSFKGEDIYWETIYTENKTEKEIEDLRIWYLERFRDYMRYIPKNVIRKNNCYQELEYWFTYLDDVREHF
jgi:hypothetical protein